MANDRATLLESFARDADLLVMYDLDLLAQIEAQRRAVQHTIDRIQPLRGHGEVLLSDEQARGALAALAADLTALESQLLLEVTCCRKMTRRFSTILGTTT
jgi:hypothetical protein